MTNNTSKISKKIKKAKFTEKRNPYKKYLNQTKWKWEEIFLEINLLKIENSKAIKNTAQKYNINYGTLRNKYNKFNNDSNYKNINNENRGVNKYFTENEENEIFLFIKNNFIDKNRVVCNDIIKIHALEKFKKIYPDIKFNASDGWCTDFKKRWNLSTVKISASRIATFKYTVEEIELFLKKCNNLLTEVGPNFFSI
jgi:hypothetical protein